MTDLTTHVRDFMLANAMNRHWVTMQEIVSGMTLAHPGTYIAEPAVRSRLKQLPKEGGYTLERRRRKYSKWSRSWKGPWEYRLLAPIPVQQMDLMRSA
jgi:hypothetical protein